MIFREKYIELYNKILKEFKIDINSYHGIKHWDRVSEIGRYLSKHSGADSEVVELFAYLHDSKRMSDHSDILHGSRSAIFVTDLYNEGILEITEKQFGKLVLACRHHSLTGYITEDEIVKTCLDSDRIDFWRFDIEPDIRMLYTDIAKENDTICKFRYR